MGLIKTTIQSVKGVLSDQYKEYFYCDALPNNVLVRKGCPKYNKGKENIISNGSIVSIADGQCMIIVDNGKIMEVCAQPGGSLYDISSEPSIFSGDLSETIDQSIQTIGKRIAFAGHTAHDQRVYYFKTREIVGNKYGTPMPIPFRIVDEKINFEFTTSIRCYGEFSYRIVDPVLFYTNVCGNISQDYTRENIDGQIKSEVLTALQPAFGKISSLGIRYDELMLHTIEIADSLNEVLSKKLKGLRGISIVSFGISSMSIPEEDEKQIKNAQTSLAYGTNAQMMAGRMGMASANALEKAAENENGSMMGFMSMNAATQASGNFNSFYQQAQNSIQSKEEWTCSCGQGHNTGKFCMNCGASKPVQQGWTCPNCKTVNLGKFCVECGTKKPAGALQYRCDKCGWMPEDPTNPPKFCPECGDPFGDEDIIK